MRYMVLSKNYPQAAVLAASNWDFKDTRTPFPRRRLACAAEHSSGLTRGKDKIALLMFSSESGSPKKGPGLEGTSTSPGNIFSSSWQPPACKSSNCVSPKGQLAGAAFRKNKPRSRNAPKRAAQQLHLLK